jgi:hypothetical protein
MILRHILSIVIVSTTLAVQAQRVIDTTQVRGLRQRLEADTLGPRWITSGMFRINITQVQLMNWAAGGFSSVSGLTQFNGQANWQSGRRAWDNTVVLGIGGQRQEDGPAVKTEDRIEFQSKYGYRLSESMYVAGLGQIRTQFTEGFNDRGRRISHFLAPGYFIGGIGMDFRPGDRLSAFLSPVTARLVVVRDRTLWDHSTDPDLRVYGVLRGQGAELELGAFFRLQFTTVLAPNITFTTRGDLFSNYLRTPENIVVNWETLWNFKVNEWFATTLNTVLIYDHDVQLQRTDPDGNLYSGPATQFKQTLGVGLTLRL